VVCIVMVVSLLLVRSCVQNLTPQGLFNCTQWRECEADIQVERIEYSQVYSLLNEPVVG